MSRVRLASHSKFLHFFPNFWSHFTSRIYWVFWLISLDTRRSHPSKFSPLHNNNASCAKGVGVSSSSIRRGVQMRRVLFIFLVLGLSVSSAFAQATGQINGVVADNSGGVVPGVTVFAVESGTGISRDTVTAANGRYSFVSLRPTTYEIRAELAGFRTVRQTDGRAAGEPEPDAQHHARARRVV